MTENYAVFVEMPLKIDIPKMSVAHLRGMSYSECIEFLPETQVRIFKSLYAFAEVIFLRF